MTFGYHAPARGSRTGVADYAWTLFGALAKHGRFVPAAAKADLHLYHLGNNHLHAGIYAKALAEPGVVILHDAVLHHFLLGTLGEEEYLKEWVFNYGEWRRDMGRDLWRQRAGSSTDPRYFRFPMLRRAVERARLVVVHNPGAAAIAKASGAENIVTVPHFFEPAREPGVLEVLRFRDALGIGQGTTLFGMFGYLRETKRVIPCLRAFRKLHALRPNTALLIAGECVSRELQRLIDSEADHPAIRRLPHLPEPEFRLAEAAVECCLNLRYPAAGETSGIAIRLMGYSKPVILTENLENSDFPPGTCFSVASGIAEQAELFDHMGLVTEFPGLAREIGSAAAAHIRQHHSLETVARKLWEALSSV